MAQAVDNTETKQKKKSSESGDMKRFDFKKEWPRIRKQLIKVSQEAMALAKKGEKEIAELSRTGKLQLDLTAIQLKKERLYHLIGKEYIRAKAPQQPNETLKRYLDQFERLEQKYLETKKRLAQQRREKRRARAKGAGSGA